MRDQEEGCDAPGTDDSCRPRGFLHEGPFTFTLASWPVTMFMVLKYRPTLEYVFSLRRYVLAAGMKIASHVYN